MLASAKHKAMKTSGTAILMMLLSLAAAALLAADATVVADVDMDIIRLPSDGDEGAGLVASQVMEVAATDAVVEEKEDEPVAAVKNIGGGVLNEEIRPWACCNETLCTKSSPPTCHCLDVVDRCAAACKLCEPSATSPFRHVCNDEYHGLPGPACSDEDDEDFPSAAHSRSYPSLAAAAQLLLAFVVVFFTHSHY
nr:uncharacterized protein LOC127338090 isoform X2 [Lolium perenne]